MLNKRSTLIILALLLAPFVLAGCSSDTTTSPTVQVADTVAPLAPTVWESRYDGTVALLRWADNTESDLAGYNVYVYDPSPDRESSYVLITSQPLTTNNYTTEGLTPGTTYYFRTTAVDVSDNESAYSPTIAVKLNGGTPNDGDYPDIYEQ